MINKCNREINTAYCKLKMNRITSQAIHTDVNITKKKLFDENSNLSLYLTGCNMSLKNFNQEK